MSYCNTFLLLSVCYCDRLRITYTLVFIKINNSSAVWSTPWPIDIFTPFSLRPFSASIGVSCWTHLCFETCFKKEKILTIFRYTKPYSCSLLDLVAIFRHRTYIHRRRNRLRSTNYIVTEYIKKAYGFQRFSRSQSVFMIQLRVSWLRTITRNEFASINR